MCNMVQNQYDRIGGMIAARAKTRGPLTIAVYQTYWWTVLHIATQPLLYQFSHQMIAYQTEADGEMAKLRRVIGSSPHWPGDLRPIT